MTTRPTLQATDEEIRRAWQDVSNEQPPERVDAAILAAARRAAGEAPSNVVRAADRPHARRWFQRWQPYLAAAGVTGLAFVLLHSLPRETGMARLTSTSDSGLQSRATAEAATDASTSTDAPTPARAEASASPIAPATMPAPASPPETLATPAREMDGAAPAPAMSGNIAVADGAAVTATAEEIAPAAPAAMAAKRRAEAGDSMLGAASESRAAAAESADATVARIEDLYRRGDRAGAAEALRQLRATTEHADELLSEPLKAWARTVQ